MIKLLNYTTYIFEEFCDIAYKIRLKNTTSQLVIYHYSAEIALMTNSADELTWNFFSSLWR